MGTIVAKAVTAAAAISAGLVARKVSDGTWKFVTGKDSPSNPDDPEIEIKEAVAFAILSGVVVGVVRMLANRQAGRVLARATHQSAGQVAKKAT